MKTFEGKQPQFSRLTKEIENKSKFIIEIKLIGY